jgi:hypothetical protein
MSGDIGDYECPECKYVSLRRDAKRCPLCKAEIADSYWLRERVKHAEFLKRQAEEKQEDEARRAAFALEQKRSRPLRTLATVAAVFAVLCPPLGVLLAIYPIRKLPTSERGVAYGAVVVGVLLSIWVLVNIWLRGLP